MRAGAGHVSRHGHLARRADDRLHLRRVPVGRSARPAARGRRSISTSTAARRSSSTRRPTCGSRRSTHGITRVDALLFTHSHADHVMGLDEVRRFNVLMRGPLPVYADAATGGRAAPHLRLRLHVAAAQGRRRAAADAVGDRRPVRGRPACRSCRCRSCTASRRSSGFRFGSFAYLTDCSAIPEPSFAAARTASTSWCSTPCAIARIRRTSPSPRRGGGARASARAQTYFTHICHDLPHAETSADLPTGMALAHDGLVARHVDVAPARHARGAALTGRHPLSRRPAAVALDEPGAGPRQLRRPAPRPPEDHRAHPPRARRARRHRAWCSPSTRIRRGWCGPTRRRRC